MSLLIQELLSVLHVDYIEDILRYNLVGSRDTNMVDARCVVQGSESSLW